MPHKGLTAYASIESCKDTHRNFLNLDRTLICLQISPPGPDLPGYELPFRDTSAVYLLPQLQGFGSRWSHCEHPRDLSALRTLKQHNQPSNGPSLRYVAVVLTSMQVSAIGTNFIFLMWLSFLNVGTEAFL